MTRILRTTRDALILQILSANVQDADEIRTEYEFLTGEIVSRDSIPARLRVLSKNRLVRYASSGREYIPYQTRKSYVITAEGRRVLAKFQAILR